MAAAELRPLSTGELLDRTFSLYRSHFWLFAGIMGVPALIPLVLGNIFELLASFKSPSAPQEPVSGVAIVVTTFVLGLAYSLTYAMALAATIFAVSDVYLGRETTIRQAYARVGGKALRTLWMLIAIMLAMGLGFMLFIVPGVLVAVWYAVAIPAAVIENLKTGAAFRRSEKLTQGRRWSIFLVFVLFFVLNYVALFLFDLPAELLLSTRPGTFSQVVGSLATFASSALVGPLLTVSLSLMYYDLRVRKEGFDLEVMLSALGPGAAASAPS